MAKQSMTKSTDIVSINSTATFKGLNFFKI